MHYWKLKWQDGTEETRLIGDPLFAVGELVGDSRLLENMEVIDDANTAQSQI